SKDLVRGPVRQPVWSPDDSRIAYLRVDPTSCTAGAETCPGQVWSFVASAPDAASALSTTPASHLQSWIDAHSLLASDLQSAYVLSDDGKTLQTVPLREIYGSAFQVRGSDTLRLNPGNADLLLVSASYASAPLGAPKDANGPVGGIFLYELRSKRRVV